MNQPHGRIDITGKFSLIKEGEEKISRKVEIAEPPSEVKKVPWKWIIVIGLGILLITSTLIKEKK